MRSITKKKSTKQSQLLLGILLIVVMFGSVFAIEFIQDFQQHKIGELISHLKNMSIYIRPLGIWKIT